MIQHTNRLGINVDGVIYNLSEIVDIYYDDGELQIEFKTKDKDYFTMNKKDATYYIDLFKSTFDKIYE